MIVMIYFIGMKGERGKYQLSVAKNCRNRGIGATPISFLRMQEFHILTEVDSQHPQE